jgi:hypothetical protein
MNTKILFPLFLGFAFLAQPLFAGAPFHLISITENSSISLSVTYDNVALGAGMIVNNASDLWTVTLPTTVNLSPLDIGAWREPENSNLLNKASRTANSILTYQMTVVSDSNVFPEAIPVNDGAFVTLGTDSSDGLVVSAVFHDVAAATEIVPETGSTLALFFLSLLGLLGANRLRSIRASDLAVASVARDDNSVSLTRFCDARVAIFLREPLQSGRSIRKG